MAKFVLRSFSHNNIPVNRITIYKSFVFLTIVLFFGSCMPARHLPEGEYLLSRNKIEVHEANVDNHALRNYIRQSPNRRILGIYPFHLNIYQLADRGEENRLKQWMKNTIGEPPVIFDPIAAEQTAEQFRLFLQNKGYFNAQTDYEVEFKGKRALVTYEVKGNQGYRIRRIDYNIPDSQLSGFVYADTINSLIGEGKRYNAEDLQEERQRITRLLKDEGFFNFSRDYIFFRVDSTLNNQQVDLELLIENPGGRDGGFIDRNDDRPHKRYRINEVFIYPEFTRLQPEQTFSDTTRLQINGNGGNPVYTLLHNGEMQVRPQTIANNILLEPGAFYSLSQHELTHRYLAGLRNFRYINMQFEETQAGSLPDSLGLLNMRVELTRSPAHAFTVEAEGLNTSGNLGVAANFLFQNRNVFRGAEMLNLRLKGALEMSGESAETEIFRRLPFNTAEMGAEVSIDFPKLLFPIPMEKLSRTARPQSTILTGINYRHRPDYTRYIMNFSYGFQWSQDNRRKHQLTPLEISSIKIFNDSILQARIPEANPLILSRYRDHLIGGLEYNYTYNTQQIDRHQDFIYFRGNFESAGNLMQLTAKQLDASVNEEGSYTMFGIPFAQYLKADADLRLYRVFDEHNTIVLRLMGGIGVPYGNLDIMPFIKSYYSGGANSVRAWSIYNLGPGSYGSAETLRFDKYGDIKLEANIEYRFPVYRYWKGAFFMDAGNVWFLQENEQFPGGEFNADSFYKEVAIGAGLGVRLDFNFFLVRLDAAFPVRDPGVDSRDQWIGHFPEFNDWNLNLGIGYPF